MLSRFRFHAAILFALLSFCVPPAHGQASDEDTDSDEKPARLFQMGQDAHEAGDLQRAIELYERAIKLEPEFPEAEYQRASALVSLNRLPEAEKGFLRAAELQPEWSLPYLALGKLYLRLERLSDAEEKLVRSYELDGKNKAALIALSDFYLRTKAPRQKLQQLLDDLKRATEDEGASATALATRGALELALDDKTGALRSFDRALAINRENVEALMARADLRAGAGNFSGALADAAEARRLAPNVLSTSLLLARIYAQAGKVDEATTTLDQLDEASKRLPEVVALRNSLAKDCSNSTAEDRAATEERLKEQPNNASLLACLGAALRTIDPARSLELYRKAATVEPTNIRHATGYAAALVQARRFPEAVALLRNILANEPGNFSARSNLATALYELKQMPEAINEFKHLLEVKPDLAVAHFFIATAHDFLGEYTQALAEYEAFIARADAQKNQLEIDKVNLRLPSLRNQIKRGEGVKKKKP